MLKVGDTVIALRDFWNVPAGTIGIVENVGLGPILGNPDPGLCCIVRWSNSQRTNQNVRYVQGISPAKQSALPHTWRGWLARGFLLGCKIWVIAVVVLLALFFVALAYYVLVRPLR
jgi:hypothetical protein